MARKKKSGQSTSDRKTIDAVLTLLGVAATIVLIVLGSLAWYGYRFATNMVRDELSAQKIYFPPAGSEALNEAEYPTLQKYAGMQVVDGAMAKAYANDFIGYHLTKVAGGKTYAEVSSALRADPTNETLQKQQTTLFRGETLRGLLLGDGYGFWTFGMIAKWAALTMFGTAAAMATLSYLGFRHYRQA